MKWFRHIDHHTIRLLTSIVDKIDSDTKGMDSHDFLVTDYSSLGEWVSVIREGFDSLVSLSHLLSQRFRFQVLSNILISNKLWSIGNRPQNFTLRTFQICQTGAGVLTPTCWCIQQPWEQTRLINLQFVLKISLIRLLINGKSMQIQISALWTVWYIWSLKFIIRFNLTSRYLMLYFIRGWK